MMKAGTRRLHSPLHELLTGPDLTTVKITIFLPIYYNMAPSAPQIYSTCGGDEIWVHGTGFLTCTKLRDPEHLWCFPSHINSNTGHISLCMLTHAPLARSRLRASLPISFLNQTSTNFGARDTSKMHEKYTKTGPHTRWVVSLSKRPQCLFASHVGQYHATHMVIFTHFGSFSSN